LIPVDTTLDPVKRSDYCKLLYDRDWRGTIATAGYAVVISREENMAVVIDLSAIFQYIRISWLRSIEDFNETTFIRGPLEGQFPQQFTARYGIIPQITGMFDVTRPVSVLCGHAVDRWSPDRFKFYVGLEAGELVAFDAVTNHGEIRLPEESGDCR